MKNKKISIVRPSLRHFFFVMVLPVIVVASFVMTQNVGATAVPADFIDFLNDENGQTASSDQANKLNNFLITKPFNPCYESKNYPGKAVAGKDAGEAYTSFSNYMADGAFDNTKAWRDKSNSLIKLFYSELTNTDNKTFEKNPSTGAEGFCSYMVRMAIQVGIPITGSTVVVDTEEEDKTYYVGEISKSCVDEFSTASDGYIKDSSGISSFLTGLSDSDYDDIVKPLVLKIAGNPAPSAGCSELTEALKEQIDALKSEFCKDNPNDATCVETVPAKSCGIDGLGWLICPAISFAADILDGGFQYIAGSYLKFDSQLLAPTSGTYLAWAVFRNIANVAFVIVFLIIIFSQMTGAGVTNYGVKKMLPRLIVAAILVNISYYICQAAIDLSNITGFGLKSVFDSIAVAANVAADNNKGNVLGVGVLVAGVLGVTAVAVLSLAALVPVILAALVSILIIIVMLMARQALIVILIVIAPLAFVAFLLPNTESLFKAWRKMFMALLLLFPIVSIIFGGSSLASQIILQANPGNANMQIIALGVLTVPFVAVPFVLKGAMDGIGGLGGKINAFRSKAGGLLGSAGSKRFEGSRANQLLNYRKEERAKKRALTQSGAYTGRNALRRRWSGLNKKFNESALSGKYGDRATALGAQLENKEDAELLENATAKVMSLNHEDKPLTTAQYIQIAKRQDVTDKSGKVIMRASSFNEYDHRAAINQVANVGNVGEVGQLIDGSGNMTRLERKTLGAAVRGSGAAKEAPWLAGESIPAIEAGTATEQSVTLDGLLKGKVNAETIAKGSAHSVRAIYRAVQAMPPGTSRLRAIMQLQKAYAEYEGADARLKENVVAGGDHDKEIQKLAGLKP